MPRNEAEQALLDSLRAYLHDEGNHVGGVWGDYGQVVVDASDLWAAISGERREWARTSDYAATFNQMRDALDAAEERESEAVAAYVARLNAMPRTEADLSREETVAREFFDEIANDEHGQLCPIWTKRQYHPAWTDCDCWVSRRVRRWAHLAVWALGVHRIEAEAVAGDRARILAAIDRGPDMGDHEFNWKSYLRTIVEMP